MVAGSGFPLSSTENSMIEWVFVVVIVCSVVQSVFGMGLLVFGTPSLLLMGLGFTECLGYVLPASIALSAIQVYERKRPSRGISPYLWYICVPMIGAGLSLSIFKSSELPINRVVGVILILSVLGVVVPGIRRFLISAVERYSWSYHAVMGFIHGLSNMGGSLLSIYAANIDGDKSDVRYIVAFYYLAFSVWQVVVLLVTGRLDFSYNLLTPIVSIAVYLVLGNRLFMRASEPAYKSLFAVFMACYATALLLE